MLQNISPFELLRKTTPSASSVADFQERTSIKHYLHFERKKGNSRVYFEVPSIIIVKVSFVIGFKITLSAPLARKSSMEPSSE